MKHTGTVHFIILPDKTRQTLGWCLEKTNIWIGKERAGKVIASKMICHGKSLHHFTSSSQLLINFAKLQQLLLSEVFWSSSFLSAHKGQKAMPKSTATWKMVFMWKVTRFGSFYTQLGREFERSDIKTAFSSYTPTKTQVIFPSKKDCEVVLTSCCVNKDRAYSSQQDLGAI